MKKIFPFLFVFIAVHSFSQTSTSTSLQRPKLVVGIVVDQMRWDYLYRYYDRYSNNGFKRLLNDGYSCENTLINYVPSVTAVGHTVIFSGSIPAISGITGNDWVDQLTGKPVYATSDPSVQGVGTLTPEAGRMSPRNLLVTTVCDELRMATNFQSKVVGVSLKDRAAILPAGHSANAAFWLDDASGRFITSTYYMNALPSWVEQFNSQNRIARLIENGWNTLYPLNTYKQSDSDDVAYEGKFNGEQTSAFPHNMKSIYAKDKSSFRTTPFGNTLTLEFAKEALKGYQLGQGTATDFLTVNLASTDIVGHMYGVNAIEMEDTYLRLDKDLGDFFQTLDAKVGKGQWMCFLTADHGVAHAIGYMQKHQLAADYWSSRPIVDSLNKLLSQKFHTDSLVRSVTNYQVNFDLNRINSSGLDFDGIKRTSVDFLQRQPGILFAIDVAQLHSTPVPEPIRTMVTNGYQFKRSGSIQLILNPGWFDGWGKTGTTHGTWNPYDTHIPLIWYGWKIRPGKLNRTVRMSDIAPTVAAMLHIQMGNGSVGSVIEELVK